MEEVTLTKKELKHKSRRLSIKEGILSTAQNSFGYYYLSPFAIAINSPNYLVALFSSISGLLGPLSQIWGSKLILKESRKKVMLRHVLLESLMWIPFILIAILYYKNIFTQTLPFILALTFAFYITSQGLLHPAWFSWIGDLVDKKYRGRWFGKRTAILGFVSIILAIGSSFIVEYFKKNSNVIFGFIILFSLAFLARISTIHIIKKQYEPKIKITEKDEFTFFDFLREAHKTNFGKFAFFKMALGFSCAISSSIFSIYILRELQFGYITYMLITFGSTVFSLFILGFWGKFADKFGNYKLMLLTSILIPVIPLSLILSTSKIYLIIVPSLLSGVAWAGFDLASNNFIYENVSKRKRAIASSHYNLLIGIGVFFGGLVGATLIKYLNISFMLPIILIFFISAFFRIITIWFWLPKIKEINNSKQVTNKEMKNLFIKNAKPIILGEIRDILSIKNYLNEK